MKKLKKQTKNLVGSTLMMGAGEIALGKMGHYQGSTAGLGRMMPSLGTSLGAMATIRTVKSLDVKPKKRKNKRR